MTRDRRLCVIATAAVLSVTTVLAVPLVIADTANLAPSGAPMCEGSVGRPAHDPTKWHPLVARDLSGKIICTYGHDHGADPRSANNPAIRSRFGPLRVPGVSYPWATDGENATDNKHRAYKWIVDTNRQCDPALDASALGIHDMRMQVHMDGNLNPVSRFHSFYLQAMAIDCRTGYWGTIETGGHVDYAVLLTGLNHVPLADDPGPMCPINGDARGQNGTNDGTDNRDVWYGTSSRPPGLGCNNTLPPSTSPEYGFQPHVSLTVGLALDSFGPTDPAAPGVLHFFDPNIRPWHIAEKLTSDVIDLTINGFDPWIVWNAASGHYRLRYEGYTTRHGLLADGCATVSTDCVPLKLALWIDRSWRPSQAVFLHSDLFPGDKVYAFDGDVAGPQGQRGFYVKDPQ